VSLSTERHQALLQLKLAALVREQWGPVDGLGGGFPGGAALVAADGATVWALPGQASTRTLGGVLAWALRRSPSELHLLVDSDHEVAGVLARRSAAFALPITIWRVQGRDLVKADPAAIFPSPALPTGVAAWADVLRAHGAEPVVEHGILTGEVLGLEVARVVVDGTGSHLEVGVGRQDRRAQRLLRPDQAPEEALARAVAAVREWRAPGARPHPAATLAAERWLRTAVVAHPELVDAALLAPVPPPLPRTDLRQPSPAPASGLDRDDRPVLVVCSTGIDLDLVPTAADARLADGRDSVRLILAVPPGDDHPVTRELAEALRIPAQVVVVPPDWQAFAPVA
jgi:hypothetical protein